VAEGVKVAITSRDDDRVQAAAKQIGATGLVHDSANLDGIPILIHEVEHYVGPIDILVTNTGGPPIGGFGTGGAPGAGKLNMSA